MNRSRIEQIKRDNEKIVLDILSFWDSRETSHETRYHEAREKIALCDLALKGQSAEQPAKEAVAWMPIETAPKDGTYVIVALPADDDIEAPPRVTLAAWSEEYEGGGPDDPPYPATWQEWCGDFIQPDAWRFLPTPPAQEKCGCVESYPQLIRGRVSHGPGCPHRALPSADPRPSERRVAQFDEWNVALEGGQELPAPSSVEDHAAGPAVAALPQEAREAFFEESYDGLLEHLGQIVDTYRNAKAGGPPLSDVKSGSTGASPLNPLVDSVSSPAVAARPQEEGLFVAGLYTDAGYPVRRGSMEVVAVFVTESEAHEYAVHRNAMLAKYNTTDVFAAAPQEAAPKDETYAADFEQFRRGVARHEANRLYPQVAAPKAFPEIEDCEVARFRQGAAPQGAPREAQASVDELQWILAAPDGIFETRSLGSEGVIASLTAHGQALLSARPAPEGWVSVDAAINALGKEYKDENHEDELVNAYNSAVAYCIGALRALSPATPEPREPRK